jgi:hypothetical protein
MRGRDFERLARKHLLPQLPGFRLGRGLIYAEPFDYLLRGMSMDSSAFSREDFYLNCFVQPLYVPAEGLRFPFGFRLRDPRNNHGGWTFTDVTEEEVFAGVLAAIKEQCVPIVDNYAHPSTLERWPGAWDGLHMAEGAAYGLVIEGPRDKAVKWLSRTDELAKRDGRDWALRVGERARLITETLTRSHEDAVSLLRHWADETAVKLRAEIGGPVP